MMMMIGLTTAVFFLSLSGTKSDQETKKSIYYVYYLQRETILSCNALYNEEHFCDFRHFHVKLDWAFPINAAAFQMFGMTSLIFIYSH